jgi:unsaturated rhamnogalacturonyl hydrolase
MKKSILLLCMVCMMAACVPQPVSDNAQGKIVATLSLANPSAFNRVDQDLLFSATTLDVQPDADLSAVNANLQWIDTDADGNNDALFVLTDLVSAEQKQIQLVANQQATLVKRSAAEISIKEGGAWDGDKYHGGHFKQVEQFTTPLQYTDHSEFIRYEGPGIESELIAYRIYLDWRNGLDVFGKTKPGLVLTQIGQDGYQSYHDMADWGMDIQKVGKSAGMGGFGIWRDNSLHRISDVEKRHVIITNDGPLYSSFRVTYQNWQDNSNSYGDLVADFSMQAGSRLLNIQLQADDVIDSFAVSLPKHPAAEWVTGSLDITGRAWTYMYTFGKQSMHEELAANVVLFQRSAYQSFEEDEYNHVVKLKAPSGKLSYYAGSLWSLEQNIDLDKSALEAYLSQEVERLTKQPRVNIANQNARHAWRQQPLVHAIDISEALSVSEITRHGNEMAFGQFDTMRNRQANWEYTTGLLTQGIYQQAKKRPNAMLAEWAKAIIDSYITDSGEILTYDMQKFNIDSINAGKMLLQLYRDTGQEKYRVAASTLREQLRHHPRLDTGAFWHKQRYPYQLWLDGVYMGMPFLIEYSLMFEDGASVAEALHEFEIVQEYLRDNATGLYWHAWDEKAVQNWADPETGLSRYFWSRGMGWLAMAIVDSWALLPEKYVAEKQFLVSMGEQLAKDLLRYRVDGVWYQITDRPEALGNYAESSSSAMFTYFLAKGVALAMLPNSYKEHALSSYAAAVENFLLPEGKDMWSVTNACEVGGLGFGRDGSYEYYMSEPVIANDPKVLGPFIMMGQYIDAIKGE